MMETLRTEHRNLSNSQHVLMDEMGTARHCVNKNSDWIKSESENENVMAIAIVSTEAILEIMHRIVKEISSILRIEIGTVTGMRGLDGNGMGVIETPMVMIDAILTANREDGLLSNE